MPLWLVKATWCEDEAEASEKWEANAEKVQDAVAAVTARLRFHPHHIEARRCELDGVDKISRKICHLATHGVSHSR
jgi:hypothetical protein